MLAAFILLATCLEAVQIFSCYGERIYENQQAYNRIRWNVSYEGDVMWYTITRNGHVRGRLAAGFAEYDTYWYDDPIIVTFKSNYWYQIIAEHASGAITVSNKFYVP